MLSIMVIESDSEGRREKEEQRKEYGTWKMLLGRSTTRFWCYLPFATHWLLRAFRGDDEIRLLLREASDQLQIRNQV